MAAASKIEWTDVTWNPVRGCSRVSEGCRHCYAERIAARFCRPGLPFHGFAKVTAPRDSLDRVGGRRDGWTGKVELVESKLDEPLRMGGYRRIFVNSMSDLFHEALSFQDIARVFFVMSTSEHTFQVLTKRPERMRAFVPWWLERCSQIGGPKMQHLENLWLGVSCEDQLHAAARIPILADTPAALRFVSLEPLLGPVTLSDGLFRGIDWVIAGGETGPGARPCHMAWLRSIVRQCRQARRPVFIKQAGARGEAGPDQVSELPSDLMVKEFPNMAQIDHRRTCAPCAAAWSAWDAMDAKDARKVQA